MAFQLPLWSYPPWEEASVREEKYATTQKQNNLTLLGRSKEFNITGAEMQKHRLERSEELDQLGLAQPDESFSLLRKQGETAESF